MSGKESEDLDFDFDIVCKYAQLEKNLKFYKDGRNQRQQNQGSYAEFTGCE